MGRGRRARIATGVGSGSESLEVSEAVCGDEEEDCASSGEKDSDDGWQKS